MKKILLPLLITFCFLLESLFVELWPVNLFHGKWIIVPHFLLILILFVTIYVGRKQGIMYGFLFGLFFDVVYTEIIGIYLFMIPLIVYIIAWVMKILQSNIFISSIVTLFGVTLLELGVYEMNFLIQLTEMSFSDYVNLRLWPTLIMNLIFIIIIAFPLKKYLENYAEALRND
ncbi:rod shape-determining protein MreD [Bacillus benzoevorans]|uniref:Rod shape-determining protein MreD n=1 Tax=Bacillus benzoevorans TaxID=1456 RepID=A0A7X0HSA4_9BACI|nr:rod shape-determining protein MreD [Bacillus benzoevorans]